MKKLVSILVALCATTALWAKGIQIDGINYLFDGDSATVTYLGMSYFKDPHYSGDITIPATVTYNSQTYRVTSIGDYAFSYCYSLTSVTIPNSVTSIGVSAFLYCDSLASVTIGNSVTSIGDGAFQSCTSLASIAIPNSVTSIGRSAFGGCDSLASVTIPHSVTSIGRSAFSGCISLASITIPNSVTSIEEGTFTSCSALASVTIPNSVRNIGGGAFCACSALTSITIPNSVTSIGYSTFWYCYSLASIQVDAANTHYISKDGVLFNYAMDTLIQYPIGNTRTSYTIPNTVTSIGERVFMDCTSLTSIAIPNSVISIGDLVFTNCTSLESITIPNSVRDIGHSAFANGTSLSSITCEATNPPTCGNYCFNNVTKTIPLYVPAGSITTYQSANEWQDFTNIQAITAQEVEVTEIESEPTSTTVVIAWPAVSGSDNYTIEVKQGSKVICTIVFNAQGQLLSINFPTTAPARGIANAQEAVTTATGWVYTINGLTPGTSYTYTVVAKNAQGTTIDTKNGSFTTTGATAIENVNDNGNHKGNKIIRNGILLIERNNVYYNVQGIVVQ